MLLPRMPTLDVASGSAALNELDLHQLLDAVRTIASIPRVELRVPDIAMISPRLRRELAATLRRVADMIDLPTLQHLRTSLEEMRGLSDDWDGEGAPKPEPPAIIRAQDVLRWAEDADLQVFDVSVDTDVLGGVAVWICRPDAKSVWVSCMNNGRDTVVFSEDGRISASSWDDAARESVLEFLLGGARG